MSISAESNNLGRGFIVDLAVLLLLVLGGTAAAVWLSTLTPTELQALVDLTLSGLTLLLAQPGVFLSAKIFSNSKLPWHKRILWGLATFVVLAFVLPVTISSWIRPLLQF